MGLDAFSVNLGITDSGKATGTVLLAVLSLNPAFMFLLNQLLGLVAELTVVSHFVVLDLNYSINLQDFFRQIFPLLIFDFLPTDDWYQKYSTLSEVDDKPKSTKFEEVGYGSMLIYGNLGSLLFI
jgi:hypothetical protein